MDKLITPANLMKNTVTVQEASMFNPDLGPCCDPAHFRVHLEGTAANAWNKSAMAVFVKCFLDTHPEYPAHEKSVRDMVKIKSHTALESRIRKYRESNVTRTAAELRERQLQKNRQERKRKVSPITPTPTPYGVTSRVSSIIAAVTSHSYTRPSKLIVAFSNSSRLPVCPVMKSEPQDSTHNTMSSSLPGGLTLSPHGFGYLMPSTRRREEVGCLVTSAVLPLVCD